MVILDVLRAGRPTKLRGDFLHEQSRTLIEVDESQHFTSFRLIALELYPEDVELGGSTGLHERSSSPVETAEPDVAVESTLVGVGDRPTLHDEIADILREDGPLTTREIAERVNARGRYTKHDRTAVTDYQVHGRTKNYPQLFDRDGKTVTLR